MHKTEALLFFVLLQLSVIVLAGRLGSSLATRFGQSSAVGEIVVGLLLGPSLFGWLAPSLFAYVFRSAAPEPIMMLSQIGLLLLMFQIGLEFDFSHLTERHNRRAVVLVSIAGLALPFGLGVGLGLWAAPILSPQADPVASALFTGTAFSITALPILGRIMMEFGITRTALGVIAISAAAINDVVGWLLLAVVTTFTVAQFDPSAFAVNALLVVVFVLICWFVIRPVVKRLVSRFASIDGHLTPNLLGILIALVFIAGMATYKLGIFAIFGGFMMGVILHDEHALVSSWKARIGSFVTVFFLPIFFTYTGLRTDLAGLATWQDWSWCAAIVVLATFGKFVGSYLAARLAGMSNIEAKIIGIMMNTRALMELVVINVGYDLGVISQRMFTMLVLMAVISTVITSPCLRRWLPLAGLPVPQARPHNS